MKKSYGKIFKSIYFFFTDSGPKFNSLLSDFIMRTYNKSGGNLFFISINNKKKKKKKKKI